MHPLMYEYFLPDSLQVSRDAARRHELQAARTQREAGPRPRIRIWRPVPLT